jgi:heme-degrading monooxygenase HmoA
MVEASKQGLGQAELPHHDQDEDGVDARMICVMTRFQLTRVRYLISLYVAFRAMRTDLDSAPGLVRHAFLVEGPRTCYTLSLWESEEALERFANVPSHIAALRRAQHWCDTIWSTYWRLDAVSRSAQQWPGRVPWPTFTVHPAHPNRLVLAAERDGSAAPTPNAR